jgi:PEP-CTERM motif
MACKLLGAGVLGASLLLSTAAFAVPHVTDLGNLDPENAGSFNNDDAAGPIMDAGTFTLTTGADVAVSATIAVNRSGSFTPGFLTLYVGSPFTGTALDALKLAFSPGSYTASFDTVLGPGTYYSEITGTVNVAHLGVAGTVTTLAIPEPSTWVMFGLGFAFLGFVGLGSRKASVSIV